MEFDYKKIAQNILKNLPDRTRTVISRRFSLGKSGKPETLEAIGKSYNITRERVRQIEVDGIKRAKKILNNSEVKDEFKKIKLIFEKKIDACGGVKKEEKLLEEIGSNESKNCILFLLSLADSLIKEKEDDNFYSFWTTNKDLIFSAKKIASDFVNQLREAGDPKTIKAAYLDYKEKGGKVSEEAFCSYLEISKNILKTIDGNKIGLKSWPEVNPRTVKDKIKLILKQSEKPLHFKEIADMIFGLNESLVGRSNRAKKLHPQTVHNELIRNQDFVLVGRGYYALKDWGYNPGQVKDVIYQVLNSSEQALPKEAIVQSVLQQRMVKESTILLNLQNKKFFTRDEEGKYKIREA
ncbi:MAG TPA: sigma factor-like helix-turn-helix DNA-binding protein [Candidatus Pacearchaeota archaeon]|nr:sigma factor-like helix-turn-helix DNA-binding protein [Candidatus Pacearchaeota archaeon]HPR79706.1 sigma factor-like helix-turn-helix DNA-binding protein [Candidatus Pacearchaeota archaeon]